MGAGTKPAIFRCKLRMAGQPKAFEPSQFNLMRDGHGRVKMGGDRKQPATANERIQEPFRTNAIHPLRAGHDRSQRAVADASSVYPC